jgi:NOL1/NOP2/fmu family ribosome biogenesis protein
VQEASSLMVGVALRAWLAQGAYPADEPLLVLDLCAAPGGKTTLLHSLLPPGSVVVANEVVPRRAAILAENLSRWGATDTLVTSTEAPTFAPLAGCFDAVLVDAPCSGEGLWRRQPEAVLEWSPQAVEACAARQHGLLQTASQLVKLGGLLLYSTCTFAPEENLGVVKQLLQAQPTHWAALPVPIDPAWGAKPVPTHSGVLGYQCWPHRVRGEGFFWVALQQQANHAPTLPIPPPKLPKTEAIPRDWAERIILPPHWRCHWHHDRLLAGSPQVFHWQAVLQQLRIRLLNSGTCVAERTHTQVQLAQEAVWCPVVELALPTTELDLPTAQRCLKGEALPASTSAKGWALATHKGLRLSLLKGVGNRWNNLYPKPYRLRMDLPDAVQ